MMNLLQYLLVFGGLASALAVSVVCGLGILVWMAGGRPMTRK